MENADKMNTKKMRREILEDCAKRLFALALAEDDLRWKRALLNEAQSMTEMIEHGECHDLPNQAKLAQGLK